MDKRRRFKLGDVVRLIYDESRRFKIVYIKSHGRVLLEDLRYGYKLKRNKNQIRLEFPLETVMSEEQ